MRRISRICLGLAVVALLSPIAHDSRAGVQDPPYAGCSQSTSGGDCGGTLGGFKNSSDPNAYAEFYQSAGAGGIFRLFLAEMNGTSYYCDASHVANIQVTWPGYANMQNVQFYISWDANNYCNYLYIYNNSPYY